MSIFNSSVTRQFVLCFLLASGAGCSRELPSVDDYGALVSEADGVLENQRIGVVEWTNLKTMAVLDPQEVYVTELGLFIVIHKVFVEQRASLFLAIRKNLNR